MKKADVLTNDESMIAAIANESLIAKKNKKTSMLQRLHTDISTIIIASVKNTYTKRAIKRQFVK